VLRRPRKEKPIPKAFRLFTCVLAADHTSCRLVCGCRRGLVLSSHDDFATSERSRGLHTRVCRVGLPVLWRIRDTEADASAGSSAPGVDGGLSVALRLGDSRWKFYIESRYAYAASHPGSTQITPVTVGMMYQ